MENFLEHLLGQHALSIWASGLIWSIGGIVAVKLYYFPSETKFSWKNFTYWINDNLVDVIKGLIWALVILRLGDYAINLAKEKFGFNLPETTDIVGFMILISGFLQYKLHNKRKPLNSNLKEKLKAELK